jgi:hypothetical protein
VPAAGIGIPIRIDPPYLNLLILLNGKNAENTEFAQLRYTAGTRSRLDGLIPSHVRQTMLT